MIQGAVRPVRILRTVLVCLPNLFAFVAVSTPRRRTFWKVHSPRMVPPLLFFLIIPLNTAIALEPDRPANGYIRTVFTTEEGLPDNEVNAIVQTLNGFLWVGTDAGLARFDGEHFTPIRFRSGMSNEIPVQSLLETPDGDLWVGTDAGLARLPRAALDHFDRSLVKLYHLGVGLSDQIMCLRQSRDGVLWAGTSRGLYRLDGNRFVPVLPEELISRIEEASDGHLLLISGRGFAEWDGTRIVDHPEVAGQLSVHPNEIFHVFEDHRGVTWYCTTSGVARRITASIERLTPYGRRRLSGVFRVYEDPQGNVWVDGESGLSRVSASSLQPIAPGMHARSMYSDLNGDLWVGTPNEGLVRFKDALIRMYTTADGLPRNLAMSVLSSHDGTLWVGSNCGGLSRWDGQHFKTYNEKDGLSNSCVWTLAEDANHDLWIGTWNGGIYRFRGGHFTQYAKPQGLPSNVALCIVAARDGSLWIATAAGLSHMQNGHFRNYTTADGLSSDWIITVYQDHNGGIWVGTSVGVDHLVGERFVPVQPGLESDHVPYAALRQDSFGNIYALSLVNGISRIENNRLVRVWQGLEPLDMVESKEHEFWFTAKHGIFGVVAAELKRAEHDRDSPLDYTSFDRADGLISQECSEGQPNIAMTPDGKLWAATLDGLAMLDFQHLPRANRKPKIFVGTVAIEGKSELAGPTLTLPPGTHHLELHFDVVDLASPEKVRLQYRMDGVDSIWLDADTTRTAVYTAIPVGTHAFHVRATGSDGVWDRAGIVYDVTQRPYIYQTSWFRLVAVTGTVLLLASLYFLRLRQLTAQMQSRLEERLHERERIARELHDTLLQGFQGLILRFQAAAKKIPDDEPARLMMEKTLKHADEVMLEGRDRVKDLRASPQTIPDLSQAFSVVGEQLAHDHPVAFRVVVEGSPRQLHPIVRDETYLIGREALANAFYHAHGGEIEVEISYDPRELRLRFRDDGRGIEPKVLETGGSPAHWGLRGMRERSKKIGAHLDICSRPGAGTEIELRVPAPMAYRDSPNGLRRHWFRRFAGRGRL